MPLGHNAGMTRGRRKTAPASPSNRVLEWRTRAGLSQEQLAAAAGYRQSTGIYKLESGETKRLPWERAEAIAAAIRATGLDCRPQDLYPPGAAGVSDQDREALLTGFGVLTPEERGHYLALMLAVAGPRMPKRDPKEPAQFSGTGGGARKSA